MRKLIIQTALLLSFALQLQGQSITPEIIADLRNVSDVKLSPNARTIAYLLRVPGEDNTGMQKSALMYVSVAGGNTELVLDIFVNPSAVSWDVSGKGLYYLTKDTVTKNWRLCYIDVVTRETRFVTSPIMNIKKYALSTDGKKIAMIIGDEKTEQEKADEVKRRDWTVMGENEKFDRLYVADISEAATPKKLFEMNLHVTDFIWSPNNSTLFFKASEKPSVDWTYMYQSIYRADLTSPSPQKVCLTAGKLGNLAISPDGLTLAFCGATDINDPLPQSIFTVPAAGGNAINQTVAFEGSATDVKWISDKTIVVLAAEGCYTSLLQIDISTKVRTPVFGHGPIIHAMEIDPATGTLVCTASTPKNPYEVYVGTIQSGPTKRLTDSNIEIADLPLARQEVIQWKASDGLKIEGVLTYPKSYQAGKKYPLLLQIHGGPEGVSTNGWNTRAVYPVQWYAANGYFVLEPNYRGSQGRGVAFAKADQKDMAGKEFEDIMAGIDYLVKKGWVDNEKIGTGGFSYGGYFSAWAATKYSQRFKAAVMGAGISNWISFCGTTEIIQENSLVHWNLWWYEHQDLVWDRSPLAHINNAKTPVLIVHGSADTRVPVTQSEEMYNAFKLKNVPVQYVNYKRQPHGILEREAQIDFMNRTIKWFNQYVK